MRKAKLIAEGATWQQVNYSRCGRTDKGVSAAGQVCCLLYSASCIHSRLYQLNTALSFPYTSHPAPLTSIESSCLCCSIDAVIEMLKPKGGCSSKTISVVHPLFLFPTIACDGLQAAPDHVQANNTKQCLPVQSKQHLCTSEAIGVMCVMLKRMLCCCCR